MVFQRNQSAIDLIRYKSINIYLLWGIFPHDFEDWEAPWPAICQLEAQDSQEWSSGPNPKALRTRESSDLSLKGAGALTPKGREGGWPSSRGEQVYPPSGFLLHWALSGLGEADPHGWGQSYSGLKSSFLPETSQKPPEIMFHQLPGQPLAQSSWCIKLTITMSAVKMINLSHTKDCFFHIGNKHLVEILLLFITITDEKISFLKGGWIGPEEADRKKPLRQDPRLPHLSPQVWLEWRLLRLPHRQCPGRPQQWVNCRRGRAGGSSAPESQSLQEHWSTRAGLLKACE